MHLVMAPGALHHDNSDNSKLPPINSFSAQIFMGLLQRNWRSTCYQELLREDKDTRGLSLVKLHRSTAFLVVSNNWNDIEIPSQSFYFFLNLAGFSIGRNLIFPLHSTYTSRTVMLKQIVQVFGSNKVGGKMQGEAKNVHK